MQRFTLVHSNEFSRSNSPPEIFHGESPSCDSLPSPLFFFLFIFSTGSLQELQVFLLVQLLI